eukprot:m.9217 g.9217  ORF g.9217 m.9217 type:complete len:56 (+) comp4153_c0_seq1:998-1165(+)
MAADSRLSTQLGHHAMVVPAFFPIQLLGGIVFSVVLNDPPTDTLCFYPTQLDTSS